jgi:thiol-disulfide isomerase/thioredoxin
MKKLVLILSLFALSTSFAQEKGKMGFDEKMKRNMYLGIGDKSVFKDTSFSTWYGAEYDMYDLDKKELEKITPDKLKDVKITIVLGTWCGDSKREVPRFIKILEAVKFDEKNLSLIFVDRDKKNPLSDIEALKIKFVPTIIIYKGDKELGSIVEAPKDTLERDLSEILK